MSDLRQFATARQREYIDAIAEHGSMRAAARALGVKHSAISRAMTALKKKAALHGDSPEHDLKHPAAPGFSTKRVSTLYDEDGSVRAQWHIQEPEKQRLDDLLSEFKEGLQGELTGLHKRVKGPKSTEQDLMACYMIGDHHLGMYAWEPETGSDDYDTDIAVSLLDDAVDDLVEAAPAASVGVLVNLGDFLHANDTTSLTPASKNLLDTDGRHGRVIRIAGQLFKRLINRMLEKHEQVVVVNARGNHDPDAAIYINEMLRLYYENEPRVSVKDNFNKFVWFEFGRNLVVVHHGDKIRRQQMYEAVTRNLRDEWGRARFVYGWTGHVHHKQAEEIGGMKFEVWNVLPPNDAWHAASGYGASRSMTCVVLHSEYGERFRTTVSVEQLKDEAA